MKQNFVVGIDIGTSATRVVVADGYDKDGTPRIIATAKVETKGVREGYIFHKKEAAKSLSHAIDLVEKNHNLKIKKAYVSLGGISLLSYIIDESTFIPRQNAEVTESHIDKLMEACERTFQKNIYNRKIIHAFPLAYRLDGEIMLESPVGMRGARLEMKALFVTCREHHFHDLVDVVGSVGIDILGIIASPYAESFAALTEKQKMTGCALINIGAETTSLVVFEDGRMVSLEVFPLGSTQVTNDLALAFQIPPEEAERLKMGESNTDQHPKKQTDRIIGERLAIIFGMVQEHLKNIGKEDTLAAGAVLTGGGSLRGSAETLARHILHIPAQNAPARYTADKKKLLDISFLTAYGLCYEEISGEHASFANPREIYKSLMSKFKYFLNQLMP